MEIVIPLFLAYIGIGLVFGVFFAMKGAAILDPVAKAAPIGFRLLVLPGSAALWPLLLSKLLRKKGAAV
ncbi:MAG: putative branched-subunit amino acid permease [Planctomycetota bacterium]|jgi:predicted branched-subunit amino acid permease